VDGTDKRKWPYFSNWFEKSQLDCTGFLQIGSSIKSPWNLGLGMGTKFLVNKCMDKEKVHKDYIICGSQDPYLKTNHYLMCITGEYC
jgi:hypothetical protein